MYIGRDDKKDGKTYEGRYIKQFENTFGVGVCGKIKEMVFSC